MKVLKKRVARLERADGGDECRGCFLLLVRRTIYLANLPDTEEPLPEDDPAWLAIEQYPAIEGPAKESATIILPTAPPEEPDEQPSYQRVEPDWRAMPSEMQLNCCPVCGQTNPMSTIHALRRFLSSVDDSH
jgi:hypothetical protein